MVAFWKRGVFEKTKGTRLFVRHVTFWEPLILLIEKRVSQTGPSTNTMMMIAPA